MAFFIIAYEKKQYGYKIVEAESWTAARGAQELEFIETEPDGWERTKDYDSGPWATREKAGQAIDEGLWNESDED